jgi:hypothetical protein
MVQIPLRRAHRLRAISLASATKTPRPQATERTPTAWHANDEYINAEASEEASASSTVANVSEKKTANQDERSIGHEHGGSRTTAPTKSTWPQRILVAFVATNGIGQGLTPTQEPNPLLTD